MFEVVVQNVTGSRKDVFTADSLAAAKKRGSEILRNGVIHYSGALIYGPNSMIYSGHVSIGGHRTIWTRIH